MQPDHIATDFAVREPALATPLAPAEAPLESQPRSSVFTRMTFCFAWLFGLEPFLTAPDASHSRLDRH